jgi:hypothetical protein
MKKKRKKHTHEKEETFFVGSKSAASASDCTGLIQTPAESEEELLSYSEIYGIPCTKKDYPYNK